MGGRYICRVSKWPVHLQLPWQECRMMVNSRWLLAEISNFVHATSFDAARRRPTEDFSQEGELTDC